jgi:hypothetical protein
MAVTFGLMAMLTPMRILNLFPLVLIVIWGLIAPVYLFIMPQLETGLALLTLIFCYTFACGLLHGRLAPLKALALPLFVMMTGISNQQSYSFIGLVDGALMMILGIGIAAVMQSLLSPSQPAQTLLSSVRLFLRGCARVTGEFSLSGSVDQVQSRRLRKRRLQSLVLPLPAKIQAAQKNLDYRLYPDNTPEKVQRLHDSVRNIADRMQTLEMTHRRIERRSAQLPVTLALAADQACGLLRTVFERWEGLVLGDELEPQQGSLMDICRNFEHELDALESGEDSSSIGDDALIDLYTMLGGLRGLIGAMAYAQGVINQINWQQWETARF